MKVSKNLQQQFIMLIFTVTSFALQKFYETVFIILIIKKNNNIFYEIL